MEIKEERKNYFLNKDRIFKKLPRNRDISPIIIYEMFSQETGHYIGLYAINNKDSEKVENLPNLTQQDFEKFDEKRYNIENFIKPKKKKKPKN